MKKVIKIIFKISVIVVIVSTFVWAVSASDHVSKINFQNLPPDTIVDGDTTLPYPFQQNLSNPLPSNDKNGLYLKDPSNVTTNEEYDPEENQYILERKLGKQSLGAPTIMSFDEYQKLDMQRSLNNYWKSRASANSKTSSSSILQPIRIGGETFDRIFGGNTIDIRPQGSAELIFGILSNKNENASLNVRQRRTTNFDFKEKIQMNVSAKIGDKIEFQTNYNTEASFEFENKLKLKYEGKEDEIIKLIEAGDITFPLNSTLITGSQSLFGIKTQLQFGKTTVTGVYSEQKSQTQSITVQGGAQTNKFSIKADEYEENRHFFIAKYFRDHYENGLSDLPLVRSNVNITKIEVWVTQIGAAVQDNRNIVALADLGEYEPYRKDKVFPNVGQSYPSNTSNNILSLISDTTKLRNINKASDYLVGKSFVSGQDFEVIESARKLTSAEYSYNSKLGFISLNTTLNSDQVLGVAIQYTVIGDNKVYQVGEFSDQGINAPQCLVVKLLKSTALNTRIPMWNLMMKNIYSLGAYQINQDDFTLNILYSGNENGIPTGYFTEGDLKGTPLLQVFNFDNLNTQKNPPADGMFDFIDGAASSGGTVQSSNGRIYFTMLEPFGQYLRNKLGNEILANKYCFDSLYSATKTIAQQYPAKNKFVLEGMYKSSISSEISLNALNVPEGSVVVKAGGIALQENVDYTVDYTLGMVRIINDGYLNSGTPITISLENNANFNVQTQRLVGAHVEHAFSNDFKLGATILNMRERPLTQKTNLGYDPISNTIWGMDVSYQTESRWLTKMIDKLPFISTKAPSRLQFNGEFAHFIPGHSKAIGSAGTSYIDDFEGSESSIDLKNAPIANWFIASTPQGQTGRGMFPEAASGTGIEYGFNRAKLAWYTIDPLFYETNSSIKPSSIDKNELSKNAVRPVLEKEVFPNVDPPNGIQTNLSILNLVYYPSERGQYNYDVDRISGISSGMNQDGTLKDPETRWGGIMRKMETTDFEATNVEYIEFWMMDPFAEDTLNAGGDLYFNLGDVSEDILRDGRKGYENGLPTSSDVNNVDTTVWGRVPSLQSLIPGFDNADASRKYQDVGYDGLDDNDEASFFDGTYLQRIATLFGPESDAYQKALDDPSADDYQYFLGGAVDKNKSLLERYKNYNGSEGNSPAGSNRYATTVPNVEDINKDNTLSTSERYFQYRVELRPDQMQIGKNYITDINEAKSIPLENGKRGSVKWYQFKIPIRYPEKIVGNIQDFKSIRFMRMFFKNFASPIVCRFATLELVRGEWRKYDQSLLADGEYIPNDEQHQTQFDVSTVNYEENGSRSPIPYVLPPDIQREVNVGTITLQQMNEQAMDYKVVNLLDGDARAAYKATDFDFRQYKKLKMYVHAEEVNQQDNLQTGELTAFIRLGSDFTENYYEYEIPVAFTPWHTSASNAEAIWPDSNAFDIDLEELIDAKIKRNEAYSSSGTSNTIPYVVYDGSNKITIVGTPNLSDVKSLMIGVRNPKKKNVSDNDDGLPKSGEFWFNELRVSGFDEKSGFAATGRLNMTLADLGNVIVSGSYSTPGFGSIEKRVSERQKETATSYDVATNLELGKFLPEKSGIRVPMHFDFSESRSNPEYNPLDPDVKMSKLSQKVQDSLKKIVQDYTLRKNINFTNVRKEKVGANKKSRVYDIENFDLTYAYSEIYHRDVDIQYDLTKTYRGGIGYNFINQPKIVKPFDKIKLFSKYKTFQLIKDFNFYYAPKLVSFRTDMNRQYEEQKYRSKTTDALIIIEPTYVKNWEWSRTYDLKYDFSQNLKFEYNANANAYIDEPAGKLDKHEKDYKEKRDSIIDEILGLGTMQRFNQSSNITYTVPINKIPLLNWTNLSARYGSTYRWEASASSLQETLGNTIENSNNKQLNGNLKFSTLYNKIGFLKDISQNNKKPPSRMGPGGKRLGDKGNLKPELEKKAEETDSTITKKPIITMKGVKNAILTVLTGLKEGSISYSETNGTLIPGFTPTPNILGLSTGDMAPGLGFVFGSQSSIRDEAQRNGWFTTDPDMTNPYITKQTKNFSYKGTFEPVKDLRIELTGDRTESFNHQTYYVYDTIEHDFNPESPQEIGSYSVSYGIWNTSFDKELGSSRSQAFEDLKENRRIIAARFANSNPNWDGTYDSLGYPVGYGATSVDVLIPSMLAAYSGKSAGSISLNPFPRFPVPNWRLTYGGLSKIEAIRSYVKNVNISHAYRSTYSVASYATNLLYHETNGYADSLDANNNFISKFDIDAIVITEQYSPLFGIDITWQNNLSTRFEYKRSRNLSMSFTNNQLTEISSNELVFGLGYRFKEMEFILKSLGIESKKSKVKSDLNIKADISIRNNKTVLRRLVEDSDQISAGQKLTSINVSADYVMNQNLTIRLFFEKTSTNPFVSTQYPNSTTNAGLSLRFSLTQ